MKSGKQFSVISFQLIKLTRNLMIRTGARYLNNFGQLGPVFWSHIFWEQSQIFPHNAVQIIDPILIEARKNPEKIRKFTLEILRGRRKPALRIHLKGHVGLCFPPKMALSASNPVWSAPKAIYPQTSKHVSAAQGERISMSMSALG